MQAYGFLFLNESQMFGSLGNCTPPCPISSASDPLGDNVLLSHRTESTAKFNQWILVQHFDSQSTTYLLISSSSVWAVENWCLFYFPACVRQCGWEDGCLWGKKGWGTQIPVSWSDLRCPDPPGFLFSLPVGLLQIHLLALLLLERLLLLLESRKSSRGSRWKCTGASKDVPYKSVNVTK